MRVTRFPFGTFAHPESHAYRPLVELLADSFDVAWAVWVLSPVSTQRHVHNTINGSRTSTFCSIECKIPPVAAIIAVSDAEISIPEDPQCGIFECFLENAFLLKQIEILVRQILG